MARIDYQIKPNCHRCLLHKGVKSVCMKGANIEGRRKMMIFTDYPDYVSDASGRPYDEEHGKLLRWLLSRMSISEGGIGLDYTLRCYGGNRRLPSTKAGRAELIEACSRYRFATIAKCKPRVIVVLGEASMEAFTGKSRLGDHEGHSVRSWESVVAEFSPSVFVSYSLAYLLIAPGDTPKVFRTIFAAAKLAGLNPKINATIPPYKWRNLK